MNELKPGIKTTEFYGSAFVAILGALSATGIVNPDSMQHISGQVPEAVSIINSVIDGIIRLVGIGAAVMAQLGYTKGRAAAKKPQPRVFLKK